MPKLHIYIYIYIYICVYVYIYIYVTNRPSCQTHLLLDLVKKNCTRACCTLWPPIFLSCDVIFDANVLHTAKYYLLS